MTSVQIYHLGARQVCLWVKRVLQELTEWFSKCGAQTSSQILTWEHVRHANSQPPSQTYPSEAAFGKISWWPAFTSKLEEHWLSGQHELAHGGPVQLGACMASWVGGLASLEIPKVQSWFYTWTIAGNLGQSLGKAGEDPWFPTGLHTGII